MKKFFYFLVAIILTTNAYALQLSSSAFSNHEMIPRKYTCEGQGVSPDLFWENIPGDTKSFTLILEDPGAPTGTWTHWILVNIPPTIHSLKENISKLPQGTIIGVNSWLQKKYGAPCPPSGKHPYIFKLYALDTALDSNQSYSREKLLAAIQDHVLDSAQLIGYDEK